MSILVRASLDDARDIAALQTESWRSAYRNLLPGEFLAGPVVENRRQMWEERMEVPDGDGRLVLKAMDGHVLAGFTCVVRDADPAWGPLLDNLHVKPALKGRGIGWMLFKASLKWSAAAAPGQPMHLWVIEGNAGARAFYDRQGGAVTDRRIVEVIAGTYLPALRYVWTCPERILDAVKR